MRAALFLAASALAGCSGPGPRSVQLAEELGLSHRVAMVRGDVSLAIFSKSGASAGKALHVYIEGDGTPWLGGSPAGDPTPRGPIALRLLARDPAGGVLIGRPCYHGIRPDPPCEPGWWTDRRYGPAVVDNMAEAISSALPPGRPVTLIGYSGGGVLAVLLAERLPAVDAVVTVAANLDIDTWADMHGYERLTGSLNPARRPPLATRIRQLHLSGARDANAPPFLAERFAARQPSAQVRVFGDFDHVCCWVEAWPAILAAFGESP